MSTFTTPLVVEFVGPKDWRLARAFEYHIGTFPSWRRVEIPVGFPTDGASVPRVFWNIFSPWGRYAKAAVVHDYLYAVKAYKDDHDRLCDISRFDADAIFLEAMKVLKVPWLTRTTLYLAVRLFGWFAWRRHD